MKKSFLCSVLRHKRLLPRLVSSDAPPPLFIFLRTSQLKGLRLVLPFYGPWNPACLIDCLQIQASFINLDVAGASLYFDTKPWAEGVWAVGQASASLLVE